MHMISGIMNVMIFAAYKLVVNGTIEKSWRLKHRSERINI